MRGEGEKMGGEMERVKGCGAVGRDVGKEEEWVGVKKGRGDRILKRALHVLSGFWNLWCTYLCWVNQS